MKNQQVLHLISDGANYYLQQLGYAKHMCSVQEEYFSIIYPQEKRTGVSCLFNIDYAIPEEAAAKHLIERVLAYHEEGFYIFWGFEIPDRFMSIVKELGVEEEVRTESIPMAIMKDEFQDEDETTNTLTIQKIKTAEEFRQWAEFNNEHLFDTFQVLHPEYHYYLCETGELLCYWGRLNNTVVTVSSILKNKGMWSLEFVSTHSEYRRKGYAKELNRTVLSDCFKYTQTDVITLRSTPEGKRLYISLGFKEY